MTNHEVDRAHMQRAIRMAMRGQGFVEPNPMVGCVIAEGERLIAEGWHRQFGDAHAEVNAINAAADADADLRHATLYVTLEPCAHHGKTPPCVDAIIRAGVRRVVVAMTDPFELVRGQGIRKLEQAGIDVVVGVLEATAKALNSPYLNRLSHGKPWVLAKWAMTLDGKIATHTGSSQWITNGESRKRAHQIRGRMDAIIVGRQTVVHDDPALTARPPGPRTATRVIVDSQGRTPIDCRLVATANNVPTMIVVAPDAPDANCEPLRRAGCEVWAGTSGDANERLGELLDELGRREWTNVLVEGGGALLGAFFDQRLVDEVHVFSAPKIIGGHGAVGPVGGQGMAEMANAWRLDHPSVEVLDDNLYVSGRLSGRIA